MMLRKEEMVCWGVSKFGNVAKNIPTQEKLIMKLKAQLFAPFLFLKRHQFNILTVKHCVCEVINPVAYNGCQGVVAGSVLHWLVLVAEDKEVNSRVEFCLLLSVLVEACLGYVVVIASFHLITQFLQTVLVRPTQGQTYAHVGV